MNIYKIVSITGKNGEPRTDGRYPERIGCTGVPFVLRVGLVMAFDYCTCADGSKKEGILQTSTVDEIVHTENGIVVTTQNSVYTMQQVGTEEDAR